MAKTAYSATDANGTVHTRKSDRGYTHTVVARMDRAALLERANSKGWEKTEASNYRYAAEQVAAGAPRYSFGPEKDAAYMAACAATVSVSLVEYHAKCRADRIAAVEATDFVVFHNLGWCGRPDLAQKLAAKSSGGIYRDITILEAVA